MPAQLLPDNTKDQMTDTIRIRKIDFKSAANWRRTAEWLTILLMLALGRPESSAQIALLESVSRPYQQSQVALGDSGAVEFSSDAHYAVFLSNAQNLTRNLGNGLIVNV